MSQNNSDRFNTRLTAGASMVALASCLALAPLAAEAAGLGRLTVLSMLGQPLRAEIELSATRDELSGMSAKVASGDAFRQAGIEYHGALTGIRFAVDKRPNGQPIVRLTSERPLSEPFVDMLVELTWSSGRLVREYTFLLDPPDVAAQAPEPVVPAVRPPERAEAPAPATPAPEQAKAAEARAIEPKTVETKPVEAKPAEKTAAGGKDEGGEVYRVKSGDNLKKIATGFKPEGVTLDQMLVGMLWTNREAFVEGNMNRLKAGKILRVPAKEQVAGIAKEDAAKEIRAQAADWNAYRRKLAAAAAQAPAADDSAKQESAGKLTAKVEDKAPAPSAGKDQVKVSKTETKGAGAPATAGRTPPVEDQVAYQRAAKENKERVAALEKNVADLQKLAEMKNPGMAEVQNQAETAKPTPAGAKPEAAKPVAKPEVVAATPAAPAAPAPTGDSAKPAAPEAAAPVEVAKPVEPVKPVEMPKPKPKAPVAPPPEEESSIFADLLGNPAVLGGLGAIVAALGGLLVYRRRQKKNDMESPSVITGALSQPSLGANSVFRATGGQSVDTSNVTPATTDFSQAGPGVIDTDDVDPVAEAEVYMAYGRDAQAEEILLEALQKDPKRLAIHLKLLEIYANRKSSKQFETLATELFAQTGGNGPEWEKVAAMGVKLDPANPLYSGGAAAAPSFATAKAAFDPGTPLATAKPVAAPASAAPAMSGAISNNLGAMAAAAPNLDLGLNAAAPAQSGNAKSFDFDLGDLGKPAAAPAAMSFDVGSVDTMALGTLSATTAPTAPLSEDGGGLNFEITNLNVMAAAEPPPAPAPEPMSFDAGMKLDFDFGSASHVAPAEALQGSGNGLDIQLTSTGIAEPAVKPMDISALSLDLAPAPALGEPDLGFGDQDFDKTLLVTPGLAAEMAGAPATGANEQEVATKLDLAKAYEEMGDAEGARELLQEVLNEGSGAQREAAKAALARLG